MKIHGHILGTILFYVVNWLKFCQSISDEVLSEIVDVQVRKTRSSLTPFEVTLSAFGQQYNLRLKRANPEAKPIFSRSFSMVVLDSDENGHISTQDMTPSQDKLKESEKNIFVDHNSDAALKLDESKNGKYQVNGFLGQGRSISSENGVHKVSLSRYIPQVPDYEDLNRTVQPILLQGRSWVSTVVQPEVLVILDNKNSQLFKGDSKKITDYFSIFFHSVNNRYLTLSEPKISFVINAVIQMNSTNAQPFIEKNKVAINNGYDIVKVLDGFSHWLYMKRKILPKHDLASLVTGNDLTIQELSGNYALGVNGRAYIKGACWSEEKEKKFMGVSVTEDMGGFWDGAWTLAHELAHNLGAFHDGEGEATECDWSLGNIMSYSGWGNDSKFYFSKCSIKSMSTFLKSTGATCLKHYGGKSDSKLYITNLNVGDRLNFTSQCQLHTKNPSAFVDPDRSPDEICRNIVCRIPHPTKEGYYSVLTLNKPAGDGSTCDVGKQCMNGKCVDNAVEQQMDTPREEEQIKEMHQEKESNPGNQEETIVFPSDTMNKTEATESQQKLMNVEASDLQKLFNAELLKKTKPKKKKKLAFKFPTGSTDETILNKPPIPLSKQKNVLDNSSPFNSNLKQENSLNPSLTPEAMNNPFFKSPSNVNNNVITDGSNVQKNNQDKMDDNAAQQQKFNKLMELFLAKSSP